jgi:hypothetical protein
VWQREVYGPFVERGMTPHHPETADAERAAQLDRQAAAIVVENAANSPASIAARYEDTYIRNGWQAYGEIPGAVRNARTNVDRLIASDGELYERQANGRWVSDGMLYDSTASGRLHEELESTRTVLESRLPSPREIPPAPQMDADARLRDALAGAYRNGDIEASERHIAAAAAAVRATWEANGLDPATTALQVRPQSDGRYSLDSPIASLRLDADGKTYVIAAETTPADIERARTNMTSSPHAIERPSEQEREVREQAQREENLQRPAQDGLSKVAPVFVRTIGASRREDEPLEYRGQERATSPQTEQIAVTSTIPATPRLPDPRDPGHADHPFYKQLEHGVASIDAEQARSFNATSERLTMSAFHDAKAAGITSADHVAINQTGKRQEDGAQIASGTLLFVVQGQDPSDPAARRSMTDVVQAVDRPVEQSLQKVDALTQQQAQAFAQPQNQWTQDEPSRMHKMV